MQATASPMANRHIPPVVSSIVMLCRGKSAEGKPHWAYVCMMPSQAELFYQARKDGSMNLEDYGTILEWGEGESPSDTIRGSMSEKFGVRDNVEAALIKLIEQQGGKT